MCRLERIHNGLFSDHLYSPNTANDFSYKTLQASRWENEFVEYSRRLEEATVVGRAGVCRNGIEYLRSLLVLHRGFPPRRVRGLSLALLLAADTASRLDTGLHNGADVHNLDAPRFQGDVLLLP